ncbi:MAG: hypothetical protein J7L15_00380 [Clostridiales bacterium]|nr:hypothetical protein [Clostridiales bacterium]
MKLAKALKEKNRLVKKIRELQVDISTYNSVVSDSEREVDIKSLMTELDQKVNELIVLKTKIFEASRPIRESIFRLSELKSKTSFLSGIDTTRGKVRSRHVMSSDATVEYNAVLTKIDVDSLIENSENEIDSIQEEIDTFNHTAEIE